jgi:hypothetical protein
MNQTVSIAGHIPQKTGLTFSQHTDFSKLKGDILIFHHCATKALNQYVAAKVEQRFKTSPHIRLGCRNSARVTEKGVQTVRGQRPQPIQHPPDPRNPISNDGRAYL